MINNWQYLTQLLYNIQNNNSFTRYFYGVVSLLWQLFLRHSLILRPCIPDCIIISFLIATANDYRIIARSGYWKYDHECHKTHQIKRVCGTCYAHEFNLNAFRHEWSYIQYSRRAIDYYIYFINENKRYSRKFRWTMFSVFLRVNVYLATSLRTYTVCFWPYHLTCFTILLRNMGNWGWNAFFNILFKIW
jgi:hypothetical protein